MWFNRKKQPAIRSLIGEGTQIHGELRFDAGLRIDGEVLGDVIATEPTSLLVISENARVQGKVMANHVIINNQIQEPMVATTLLELQPKTRIVGDVHYETLEMHQGTTIDRMMKHMSNNEAEIDRPLLKLAAANEV